MFHDTLRQFIKDGLQLLMIMVVETLCVIEESKSKKELMSKGHTSLDKTFTLSKLQSRLIEIPMDISCSKTEDQRQTGRNQALGTSTLITCPTKFNGALSNSFVLLLLGSLYTSMNNIDHFHPRCP